MKLATSAAFAFLLAPAVLGQPVPDGELQESPPAHHSKPAESQHEYGEESAYEAHPRHGGPPPHPGAPQEGGKGIGRGLATPFMSLADEGAREQAQIINPEQLPEGYQKYGHAANHYSKMYSQLRSGQIPPEFMGRSEGQPKPSAKEASSLRRRAAYADPEAEADADARAAVYDSWLLEASELHARSLDDRLVARSPTLASLALDGGKAGVGFLKKNVLTAQNQQRLNQGMHAAADKLSGPKKLPGGQGTALYASKIQSGQAPGLNKAPESWPHSWGSSFKRPPPPPAPGRVPPPPPPRQPPPPEHIDTGAKFQKPKLRHVPESEKSKPLTQKQIHDTNNPQKEEAEAAKNATAEKKPGIFNSNNIMAATMVGSMIPAFMPQGDKDKDKKNGQDGQKPPPGQPGAPPPPGGAPGPGGPGGPGAAGGPRPPMKMPAMPAGPGPAPVPPPVGKRKRDLSRLDFYDRLAARSATPQDELYARDADADARDYLDDEAALWARDAEPEPDVFDDGDHELMARWAAAEPEADAWADAYDDGFDADELSRRDLYAREADAYDDGFDADELSRRDLHARDAFAEADPDAWAEAEAFDDDYYGEY